MRIEQDTKLDFDDVLILPQRSELVSRQDVNITRQFRFKYSPLELNCSPLIAANLDTVGTLEMAESLSKLKCLTALHKFYPNNILGPFLTNKLYSHNTFYTLGIRQQDQDKFKEYIKEYGQPELICIDVPNAYLQTFVTYCSWVRSQCPMSIIMAGNVVTADMCSELIISGKIDICKVGLGSGSQCLTRKMTGIGLGQISAIDECSEKARCLHAHICSDGGIRSPGDFCKSLCAGADFNMLGTFLAGTDSSQGEWIYDYSFRGYEDINPEKRKKYLKIYGMSSNKAMKKYYGDIPNYKTSEGQEETLIPYKGPVEGVVEQIFGGVRSCATYLGAKSIFEMSKCATFIKMNR